MFQKNESKGYKEILDGVLLKTRAHGDKTLLAEFRLTKGSQIPAHAHPYEQTGYLVSGKIRLTIGEEAFDAGPGDAWCIADGVEHRAEIIEDAVAVEVFSPVREDYLPENQDN